MGKVIALCTQKGGTAKTSSAIEIATCLTKEKYKVVLIDLDQQCDASRCSKAEIENTINDVFQSNCKLIDAIQHNEWYDIIPGTPALSRADATYIQRDDVYLLSDVCDILLDNYDFVVIDNPPARNVLLNMTYIAADYVICPTLSDVNSILGIIAVDQDLSSLRNSRNKESHAYIIGILLTCYENTVSYKKAESNIEDIANELPGDVFCCKVRKTTKMNEVKLLSIPLQIYERHNNASVDYRKITNKILDKYKGDINV